MSSTRWAAWVLAAVVAVTSLPLQPAQAAPGALVVGVVEFYAISPVSVVVGMAPQQFAADELSGMLASAGRGQFTMIPRATMQQAEREMRWREEDVLHFDRLRTLASLVHADRLVVGWIQSLEVGDGSTGGARSGTPRAGGTTGFASLVVQVFDARQGRIVAEERGTGDSRNLVRSWVTREALRRALEPILTRLLPVLTSS